MHVLRLCHCSYGWWNNFLAKFSFFSHAARSYLWWAKLMNLIICLVCVFIVSHLTTRRLAELNRVYIRSKWMQRWWNKNPMWFVYNVCYRIVFCCKWLTKKKFFIFNYYVIFLFEFELNFFEIIYSVSSILVLCHIDKKILFVNCLPAVHRRHL